MSQNGKLNLLGVALLAALSGCVRPGEMDMGSLSRYQRAMAARGVRAADRAGGAGLLRPAGRADIPPLAAEPIVTSKIVRRAETHEVVSTQGKMRRVRKKSVVEATVLVRDAGTGQFTFPEEVDKSAASRLVEIARSHEAIPSDGGPPRARVTTLSRTTWFLDARGGKEGIGKVDEAGADKVVRITCTHRLIGGEGQDKRFEVSTKTETLRFLTDPKTGKITRQAKTDQAPREITAKYPPRDFASVEVTRGKHVPASDVPEDSLLVKAVAWEEFDAYDVPADAQTEQVFRVGRKSRSPALTDGSTRMAHVSLDEIVMAALASNPYVRVVSYDPAISREQMIRAAAAFDYVVYGAMNRGRTRSPTLGREVSLADPNNVREFVTGDTTRSRDWAAGIRQHTVTGADWSLEWAMSRTWDASGFGKFRRRYEPVVVLQVTQPLLRGAWPDFNLAELRIARLAGKISEARFRETVEAVVTQVIVTYWELVQARRELRIRQQLLADTRKAFRDVEQRRHVDATVAAVKLAEAAVKRRQAELIDARRSIRDVQDRLIRLAPSAQLKALSGQEILPTTAWRRKKTPVDATEKFLTAMRHNPKLLQARLAIAGTDVEVARARNLLLPALDLAAEAGLEGLGSSMSRANDELFSGDYASYSVGLLLEQPIGNREARARLRQTKFVRAQAAAQMRDTAEEIALALTEQARRVHSTYKKIEAYRGLVQAERVRLQTIEQEEQIHGRLTPEFLETKLQAQEDVALAERTELEAIFDYNRALAEIEAITGTVLELHHVKVALPTVTGGAVPAALALPAAKPATR